MNLVMHNKRAMVFGLLVLAVSLPCSSLVSRGQAQGTRLPQPNGHVNDFAEVIDTRTKQRLETILENLKQRRGIDFVIATVKSVGGEELYDYSLRVAKDWNVGPASSHESLLLLIVTDKAKFFAQFSRIAQADLPDGLMGEMGRRMRPKFESGDYNGGLITGMQTFVSGLGERGNLTFEALDQQPAENLIGQTRPRTMESPAPQPSETPTAPSETSTPQTVASPTPAPAETSAAQVSVNPTPPATPSATPAPSASVAETPQPAQPLMSPIPSPTPQLSETPAVATPSPGASPQTTNSPAVEAKTPQPSESPIPQPSTSIAENASSNPAGPTRSPGVTRKAPANTGAVPANPEDEKEQVELTLTLPAEKRIEALQAFIAAHPQSVAVPRATELIIVAHAVLGDQRLQAGDVEGGLQQFRLAMSEAPTDMTDRLFTEVVARVPPNLFLRGQRAAAIEAAHQAEALAKLNPKRLLALAEFYLAIEDAGEANRIAESATRLSPDSAAAHQALGAARHIALRLDEAESEYARALALDPKSAAARVALADLKRANGKTQDALTLYREQVQADPKHNSARAGLVLSLLELGSKDEAEKELNSALQDKEQARNLPLLVGAAYWFSAHNDAARGLDLAQRAVALEPRYSWAQIALARGLVANKNPLEAERGLRFARQFGRFPTLDYELASVLASLGLYDEAVSELARSFNLKDGQIETKLAGRNTARAASFTELLAPERRAAIFQPVPADTETNAKMLKALLAFATALNTPEGRSPNEDEVLTAAQDFILGNDAMRTYRQVYVAGKLLRKSVALSSVVELMDKATIGVEVALSVPAATVAVQPEELSDIRARALARGGTPDVPDAPRSALSGLLRARIEDLAGLALFNLDKSDEAATRLRRAVSSAPEGTPLWRAAMWHLAAALEASGKNDQALLYYIKSYVAGVPDPARRAVIENVYKKVNGTLEGLDDKIGPASATATPAPSPVPTQ
jgi:tetratricopeptide (TPR) repeat protein